MALWLRIALGGLAVTVAFAAGFYVHPAPAPAVKTVERVVYKDRVVEHTVTVQTAARVETKRVVVYRDRIITKDGVVTEHEVETTDATAHETANATVNHEVERTVDRTETKALTASRPEWRVGVLVGASLSPPLLPISGPLTLGVEAQRRILGPVWLGVWALSSGAAGGSLSVEF